MSFSYLVTHAGCIAAGVCI